MIEDSGDNRHGAHSLVAVFSCNDRCNKERDEHYTQVSEFFHWTSMAYGKIYEVTTIDANSRGPEN